MNSRQSQPSKLAAIMAASQKHENLTIEKLREILTNLKLCDEDSVWGKHVILWARFNPTYTNNVPELWAQ
jgi:hypothetical protein